MFYFIFKISISFDLFHFSPPHVHVFFFILEHILWSVSKVIALRDLCSFLTRERPSFCYSVVAPRVKKIPWLFLFRVPVSHNKTQDIILSGETKFLQYHCTPCSSAAASYPCKASTKKTKREENVYSPRLCKCHELPYPLHSATPTGSARLLLPVLWSGSASSHEANAVAGLILFSFPLGSWSHDDCCPMSKNHGFMLFSFLLFMISGQFE